MNLAGWSTQPELACFQSWLVSMLSIEQFFNPMGLPSIVENLSFWPGRQTGKLFNNFIEAEWQAYYWPATDTDLFPFLPSQTLTIAFIPIGNCALQRTHKNTK